MPQAPKKCKHNGETRMTATADDINGAERMSDLCGGLASNEFQINFFICEHSHIWSFNLCSNYFQQISRNEANGPGGFEILILVLIGSELMIKKCTYAHLFPRRCERLSGTFLREGKIRAQ